MSCPSLSDWAQDKGNCGIELGGVEQQPWPNGSFDGEVIVRVREASMVGCFETGTGTVSSVEIVHVYKCLIVAIVSRLMGARDR